MGQLGRQKITEGRKKIEGKKRNILLQQFNKRLKREVAYK
jgi:hypothetical protein